MKQLAIEMIGAAIIATIVGAAFWIMDWNGFIGWVYVWVLIGIKVVAVFFLANKNAHYAAS